MTGLRYAVDLDELLDTVTDLRRCGDALDALLDDVTRRVAALHLTWSGGAAVAQSAAQSEWESGFDAMRAGLETMRASADIAHVHYSEAGATNLRMWGQVS